MPNDDDIADARRGGRFVVLLGAGVLLTALSAGLTALGWPCVADSARNTVFAAAMVFLVDEHEIFDRTAVVELAMRSIPIVAVGSLRRPLPMIAAVRAGATDVVDVDLPFVDLVESVRSGLARRPAASGPGRTARQRWLLDALHDRGREAQLLARLTGREQQVLRALAAGQSAGQIADAEWLSMATVRTHVQAVLRKLEVSSQLAAVAVARRGWRDLGVADVQLPHHQI